MEESIIKRRLSIRQEISIISTPCALQHDVLKIEKEKIRAKGTILLDSISLNGINKRVLDQLV